MAFVLAAILTSLALSSATLAAGDPAETIRAMAKAFASRDLAAMESLWVHADRVTVIENGVFNYGWQNYRDTHLAPEMGSMTKSTFELRDVRSHDDGKLGWATFDYTITLTGERGSLTSNGGASAVLELDEGRWKIVALHMSGRRKPAESGSSAGSHGH